MKDTTLIALYLSALLWAAAVGFFVAAIIHKKWGKK